MCVFACAYVYVCVFTCVCVCVCVCAHSLYKINERYFNIFAITLFQLILDFSSLKVIQVNRVFSENVREFILKLNNITRTAVCSITIFKNY